MTYGFKTRILKTSTLGLLLGLSLITAQIISTSSASATLAGFDASNIMTDDVMGNRNTMSEREIQNFLKGRNTCTKSAINQLTWYNNKTQSKATEGRLDTTDKNGKKKSYYFNLKNGNFICMADESFNGESAARIIWKAAQDYTINPQVIIVLLQKEQGLVTDQWPNKNYQYAAATGYDCPDDGGGCRGENSGFKKQIREASNMLRKVLNGGWSNYPVGENYVQYNPTKSCGGSKINIKNRATSALYRYTPYQPNSAALKAVWGEAPCGAYGNRNFYNYFTSWFGSTRDPIITKTEDLVGEKGIIKNASVSVGSATETITINKNIYTFYSDQANKSLRLSYWNGAKWTDRIIDGKGSSTPGAMPNDLDITEIFGFNHNNSLQVYYYDRTSKLLRHVFTRGGEIRLETLDGSSDSVLKKSRNVGSTIRGMTYGNNKGIQLYYYNEDDKSIEHTWWDPRRSSWATETLDGTSGSILKKNRNVGSSMTSMLYGGNSNIQLYYYNEDDKSIEHTWWDPRRSSWATETLDGTSGSILKKNRNVGSSISGLPYNGGIQLFYYNSTTGELEHTWWNNNRSTWHTERMDGDADTVLGNYINAGKVIDTGVFQKRLFVTYYDDASVLPGNKKSSWRLAYWSGSSWVPSVLEGADIGISNPDKSMPVSKISMTPQLNSTLEIFYKGYDGQLRHVWMRR